MSTQKKQYSEIDDNRVFEFFELILRNKIIFIIPIIIGLIIGILLEKKEANVYRAGMEVRIVGESLFNLNSINYEIKELIETSQQNSNLFRAEIASSEIKADMGLIIKNTIEFDKFITYFYEYLHFNAKLISFLKSKESELKYPLKD